VFTDKFQVPLAYLGFGLFTICLGALAKNSHGSAAAYLLFLAAIIFSTVLLLRSRLFMNFNYPASRAATYLIFGSLSLVSVLVAFYTWDKENIAPMLTDALFPPLNAIDFVLWGGLSLVVANGLWQLIDISGLQRLQSIDKSEAIQNLPRLANAIRNAGIEAGVGWALIIVAGLLLKLLGISDVPTLMENLLEQGNTGAYLVPLLMFTVVVFMLSTISGFMSAIAYIAHYDIAPMLNIYTPSIKHGKDDIKIARLITLTAIVCLYLGYRMLKGGVGDNISAVLYAIYAFQIAIAPSVIAALLVQKIPIRPASVMASTIAGMCVAWWTATHTVPTANIIQISAESWSVIPPLAGVVVASLVFIVCSMMAVLAEKRGRGLRPS
jgi:hypothetical protein